MAVVASCVLQPLVSLLRQGVEGLYGDPLAVPWVLWGEGVPSRQVKVLKGRGHDEAVGVEEHAVRPHVPPVGVGEVPHDGVPEVGQVEPQLVSASRGGLEQDLGGRVVVVEASLQHQEPRVGRLAWPGVGVQGCGHLDLVPLRSHVISYGNRNIHHLLGQVTSDKRQVVLVHLVFDEALGEGPRCSLVEGDAEDAAGGEIEAVGEPKLVAHIFVNQMREAVTKLCLDRQFLWVIAVDEEVVALVDHDVVRTLVQDLNVIYSWQKSGAQLVLDDEDGLGDASPGQAV